MGGVSGVIKDPFRHGVKVVIILSSSNDSEAYVALLACNL
jgi:hypothetical protein